MVTFSYEPAISIVLGLVYSASVVVVVYYAVRSTKFDPTDPTVYAQKEAERLG